MAKTGLVLVLCCILVLTNAQENTQKRVPDSLKECYTNARLLDRDSRLPATLTSLIDLIRKVEDDEQNRFSLRELVLALLYRFRVDGIKKAEGVGSISNAIIPYSTTGKQFEKHALIFSRLLPNSVKPFPNETLTDTERCSLHFMLSSTIETEVRGDEGSVCGQLSPYRSLRLPRKASRANMEYEEFGNNNQISTCPVESGVIRTKWGTVAAGPLLAGIAAGLERQQIQVRTLIANSAKPRARNAEPDPATLTTQVDNLYAATLTGDIAEAALYQAHQPNIEIGASGAWNSTSVPRWYFLNKQSKNEMTDAEIRGGLDGLIIGWNIKSWSSKASSLKLSQVLDMYYSERGVFSMEERACYRRELFPKVASTKQLVSQSVGFAAVLEKEVALEFSLEPEAITNVAENAANRLITYIPSALNDLSCGSTAPPTAGEIRNIGTATEVFIVVDTTWPYRDIVQVLSLLIDGIEARLYGSSVKVMNAKDLSIIVNTTNYAADFHAQFNESAYQRHPAGFDIQRILTSLHPMLYDSLEYEHKNKVAGGRSQVMLLVANSPSFSEADINFAEEHIRSINEDNPDLRFLVLSPSSLEKFGFLVRDKSKDLLPISVSGSNQNPPSVVPVLNRIKQIQRRVINHNCNANWERQDNQGNIQLEDNVEPDGINFYRIHPNYFFGNEDRKVSINGIGYGPINVCYSRNIEHPVSNATANADENNDVVCKQITSDSIEIEFNSPCADNDYIVDCKPLYISVAAPKTSALENYRCVAKDCRTPDQIRFTIRADNLGCYSGVSALISSFSLLILMFTVQFL